MNQNFVFDETGKTIQPTYTQLANVLVHWNNRILFVQRKTPPFAGYWSIPGGNVEAGESYEAAATRELQEETGITATTLTPLYAYLDHEHQLECHAFSTQSTDGAYTNMEPAEHSLLAWKTPQEALQLPLTPGIRDALANLHTPAPGV